MKLYLLSFLVALGLLTFSYAQTVNHKPDGWTKIHKVPAYRYLNSEGRIQDIDTVVWIDPSFCKIIYKWSNAKWDTVWMIGEYDYYFPNLPEYRMAEKLFQVVRDNSIQAVEIMELRERIKKLEANSLHVDPGFYPTDANAAPVSNWINDTVAYRIINDPIQTRYVDSLRVYKKQADGKRRTAH